MSKPLIGIGCDVLAQKGERDRAFAFTTYTEAVRNAGGIPVIIPPQPENAADIVRELDGILLAGGEDCDPSAYGVTRDPAVTETMDPRRQKNDLTLARAARDSGIPTLGICLGVQMMNVAAGGTLIQDIKSSVETEIDHASEPSNRHRHQVRLEPKTKLGAILGDRDLDVNSSHHQAIRDLGRGLRVTAHAPDGIIEGVEDPSHPFYIGVQWHPEDMAGENSAAKLFGAFVAAARKFAEQKEQTATEMSPAASGKSE